MLETIKKIRKVVVQIMILLLVIWLAYNFGRWTNKGTSTTETVYNTDTLTIIQYEPVTRIIEKIRWKEAKPCTVQVVKYEEWMDSIWTAMSLLKENDRVEVHIKKDKQALSQVFNNVDNNFLWYGTPQGGMIRSHRFSNPIHWTGIRIGCRYGFIQDILPYVSTGIDIKRITLKAELNKEDLQADISLRLF